MIFVDTGAWFAAVVPGDANFAVAMTWRTRNTIQLVTTDYIIDETLTLLRARGEFGRALRLGDDLFSERFAEIEWLSPTDVTEAWHVLRHFRDKAWSFTDCTSYVVMKRLKIKTAFAFDDHFRQFGFVRVVPA